MTAMSDIALDIQMEIGGQDRTMEISVNRRRKYMTMAVEKSTTPYPEYDGPYNVEPRFFTGHTLETRNKAMTDNVTVEPIRIYEVSNPAGGITVTIGSV